MGKVEMGHRVLRVQHHLLKGFDGSFSSAGVFLRRIPRLFHKMATWRFVADSRKNGRGSSSSFCLCRCNIVFLKLVVNGAEQFGVPRDGNADGINGSGSFHFR